MLGLAGCNFFTGDPESVTGTWGGVLTTFWRGEAGACVIRSVEAGFLGATSFFAAGGF
jgi:hypothetical protein